MIPSFRPFFLAAFVLPVTAFAATVTITVSPLVNNHPISPLSFGGNEDYGPGQSTVNSVSSTTAGHDTIPNAPYMRLGGNRLSTYNWENNADNAGADYGPNMSDLSMLYWVGATQDLNQAPALGVTARYDQWRAEGKKVLATIQAMGVVAADNSGIITTSPPAAAWKTVQAAKGSAFTLTPNRTDGTVYMDEYVNFLVNKYGNAASGGIQYYDIDNEPGLWNSTHPVAHPAHSTYVEMTSKNVATAQAILNVDPGAQILGPAFFSYEDVRNLNGASDAGSFGSFPNCASYYLDQMRQASTTAGKRLLHYLDLHYYPEAKGSDGNRIIYGNQANSTTQACAIARMQAPRSLWDSTYFENSYLTNNGAGPGLNYIPRLQGWIASYYPGTKLSFSEYYFGADWDVSGGIAEADVLGVFARYDIAGNYWQLDGGAYSTEAYSRAAFNLWLNYDGAGAKVGDIYADAATTDWTQTSAYAARSSSQPNKLWVVVLGKDYTNTQPVTINVTLGGGQSISAVTAHRFGVASATLAVSATHSFGASSITDTLPARSATVYECTLSAPFGTPTSTLTPSSTRTPTASATRTATPASTPTSTATPSRSPTGTPTRTPVAAMIMDSGFTWTPKYLTVTVGTTVTWAWAGTHEVSSDTALFTSGAPVAGGNFSYTFNVVGTYGYYCSLHGGVGGVGMSGFVFVIPIGTATSTGTPSPSPTLTATPSRSPSPSGTATASATKTATPSQTLGNTSTGTATPTATPSRSPTASATPSASPSSTGTASVTPGNSPTFTPTRSATPSASPSGTDSASVTPPNSPTFTATRSATPSVSPSVTRSATPSLTPTPSGTASPSTTPSISPTGSVTDTVTNGPSPTASPSFTPTPSCSVTPSSTVTTTSSATATPTASPTASASQTPTPSVTPSGSPSDTVTLGPSATQTVTLSPNPANTASRTAQPTASATPTSSASASPSPVSTGSPTLSSTAIILSATPSATLTATRTAVPSPSSTPAALPSATAGGDDGPLAVETAVAFPNPNPVCIQAKLTSRADAVRVKVWSVNLRLLAQVDCGPKAAGWQTLALPAEMANAANGTYYFSLEAQSGAKKLLPSRPGRLLVLR